MRRFGCKTLLTVQGPSAIIARRLQSVNADWSDEEIIARVNWRSSSYHERLGLPAASVTDVHTVKRHFRAVAKHFHPDNPSAPKDGAEAFRHCQEAYEALSKSGGSTSSSAESDSSTNQESADMRTRRMKMAVVGDFLGLFMIGCIIFLIVTLRHNHQRLGYTYLTHFLFIFAMIQVLPRVLAAAVLFSYCSSQMVRSAQAEKQAKGSLLVERHVGGNSVTLTVDGYSDSEWKDMRVQIELTAEHPASTEVVVFDKGQRRITLPVLPANRSPKASVKVLCDNTSYVITNKEITLV